MNKDTRTILVPKGVKEFEIIALPDYADINTTRKYGKSGTKIYELKSVKESPKSMILEPGYVLENSEVIMTSEFNPIYLMILTLLGTDKFAERFVSIEDITDNFSWSENLSIDLGLICETIEENGEKYYKVSKDKITHYLEKKIEKTQKYLESSRLYTFLKMELYVTSEQEITDELLALQLQHTAIDLVWAYLCIPKYGPFVDLQILIDHKRRVQSELNSKMLMNAKLNNKKTWKPKPKPNTTKTTVKVQKGKGALDSFFAKKK